jgi:Flp pilus assembly protein TadD
VAAHAGADERASRRFAALLAASPSSKLIAQRALDHGMAAGDWPLALQAARRLDKAGALPPLRRILLAAEALRVRDWAGAEREIAKMEREKAISLMVPMLRTWRGYGMRAANPGALLAPMDTGPTSGYAVEHRALLELAAGRGDAADFLTLNPNSGLRAQHLRLLAAAEMAARGDKARALALAAGTSPLWLRRAPRSRPVGRSPGRLDTAAEGLAEFLSRVAIDFNQQQLGAEGVILARLAAYLAPDNAQPVMIAAELLAEKEPAAAARLLAKVPDTSPFARNAREIRLQHLARSGQSAVALREVAERTRRGSRDPADWIQLGNLQADGGQYDQAAISFTRAHELWRAGKYPGISEWSLWLMRGGALEQGGKWPEARAALREAYRLAPAEPLVLNYLGYAQLDRGEEIEASERLIREALRLAPDSAAITDSLGWALYKTGRLDEAIPVLERAAKGEPADVEINEHLGDAYYAAGRRIEARFAWSAALIHAEGAAADRLRGKIERGLAPQIAQR